jgi:predicted kinase
MNEKILYIVRGVPGSGKTTHALNATAQLEEEGHDVSVFEADYFMASNGKYKFDSNKLAFAHMMCQRCVNTSMIDGIERIFVANTFVKRWEADVYYSLAKVWGYKVVVHRMDNSYDNVHGVPQDKVNIMKANMESYPDEIWIGGDNQCE